MIPGIYFLNKQQRYQMKKNMIQMKKNKDHNVLLIKQKLKQRRLKSKVIKKFRVVKTPLFSRVYYI